KIAIVQASPIIGGKFAGMDEKAARAVSGVRKVVRFDDTVAVIADHTGAARKGIAALNPQWEGRATTYSTADLLSDLDKASPATPWSRPTKATSRKQCPARQKPSKPGMRRHCSLMGQWSR